ncbi:hypothetical protein E6O75_ATG05086 [Venturia nashicola]|uniref:Zn(2)-C6 fungal-type domain-containing protein n=1 Tax=Venturia nashicola TaxID=86259 RepID=A0A4Z1P9T9_9PEZI|nr:hypothetical protein E6O75_ATG05086 [Venturia nashicola]
MGRRPNPILQRFFERGPKLRDASNRYQHTCKRCGEKFEKGRQETLVVHITRKCHVITKEERDAFLHDITYTAPVPNSTIKQAQGVLQTSSTLSGLDALAEVSRQHGQIERSTPSAEEFFNTHHNRDAVAREHPRLHPIMAPMSSVSSHQIAANALNTLEPDSSVRSLEKNRALVDYSHGLPPAIDEHRSRHALPNFVLKTSSDANDVSSLHQDAPAMSPVQAQIIHDQPGQPIYLVKSRQKNVRISPRAGPNFYEQLQQESEPLLERPKSFVGNLQVHQWDGSNSIEPVNAQGKKVRGAFAPDRRSAVKEVRKKGACLRCRMLKKSCDSGDPCRECSRLDNARVWKGACLRTRLAQIFELFSSGLFMVVGHHEVEAAKSLGPLELMPGRLEVSYFPQSGIAMTFPYAKVQSGRHEKPFGYMINQDHEGFGDRLSFGGRITTYLSALLAKHMETGGKIFRTSNFMLSTIELAMTMRSRALVLQALELWVCTEMLACKPTELQAFLHQSLPSSSAAAEHFESTGGTRTAVAVDVIVYLQLRRVTQRRADDLFKSIMVELEKSLIQRKQSDNFETFIGTVLLLRCVEKMCYLYRSFDSVLKAPSSHRIDPSNLPNPNMTPQWPLERPPSYFWPQGERFSDLLASMLRLRKVAPEIEIKEGVLMATSDQPEMIRGYFDAINLRAATLSEAAFSPMDKDERAWEFRYLAKVFEKTPGSFLGDISSRA